MLHDATLNCVAFTTAATAVCPWFADLRSDTDQLKRTETNNFSVRQTVCLVKVVVDEQGAASSQRWGSSCCAALAAAVVVSHITDVGVVIMNAHKAGQKRLVQGMLVQGNCVVLGIRVRMPQGG